MNYRIRENVMDIVSVEYGLAMGERIFLYLLSSNEETWMRYHLRVICWVANDRLKSYPFEKCLARVMFSSKIGSATINESFA